LKCKEEAKIRIITKSSQAFRDRKEAGQLLAEELSGLKGKETVVLGIPRGGMIIAYEICLFLNAQLDVMLSRKIGAPNNPELAIGAISEEGRLFINEDLALRIGADKSYIEAEKEKQLIEIRKKVKFFRQEKPKLSLKGKNVVLTDDGIATGSTMQAAILSVQKESPKKITVAVPVASLDSGEFLERFADEVIILRVPDYLGAISGFYLDFSQVEDSEVLKILKFSDKNIGLKRGG